MKSEQIWENKDKVLGQLVEIRVHGNTKQDAEDTWSHVSDLNFRGFELGEKL